MYLSDEPILSTYWYYYHKQPYIVSFLQLDWLSVSSGAYAGIWAVYVRFQFRVQIRNPDEKLHT